MGDVKITELSIVENQIIIQYTPGSSPSPNPGPNPSPSPNPGPEPSPSPNPGPKPSPEPSPSPNPSPDLSICEIPSFDSIQLSKTSYKQCPSINNYITKIDGNIGLTFKSIAKGWKDAGMNPLYCKNAIRVIGGECQPIADGKQFCKVSIDGGEYDPSYQGYNPFQLDSAKDKSVFWSPNEPPEGLDLNNPCHASIIAKDLFLRQGINPYEGQLINSFGYNPTCYGKDDSNIAPKTIPVDTTGKKSGYDGTTTCNWDGPFCHRSIREGKMWNGGGNSYQGSPWPCYGYIRFLKQSGKFPSNVSAKCSSDSNGNQCSVEECKILEKISSQIAQEICDSV